MKWKEFLRLDWKKFILPVIFIILFAIVINSFYLLGSVLDKYTCESVSLAKELQNYREQNDTLAIGQFISKNEPFFQNMQNEYEHLAKAIGTMQPIINFVKIMDPVIPMPCEGTEGYYCEFYSGKDTYNCFQNVVSGDWLNENVFGSLFHTEIKEYKKASFVTFGLNTLLLFIEGYLVSCFIFWIYYKIKKK
jgi:hypothetical protein